MLLTQSAAVMLVRCRYFEHGAWQIAS